MPGRTGLQSQITPNKKPTSRRACFNALIPLGNLVVWVLPKNSNKMLNLMQFIWVEFISYRLGYRQQNGA